MLNIKYIFEDIQRSVINTGLSCYYSNNLVTVSTIKKNDIKTPCVIITGITTSNIGGSNSPMRFSETLSVDIILENKKNIKNQFDDSLPNIAKLLFSVLYKYSYQITTNNETTQESENIGLSHYSIEVVLYPRLFTINEPSGITIEKLNFTDENNPYKVTKYYVDITNFQSDNTDNSGITFSGFADGNLSLEKININKIILQYLPANQAGGTVVDSESLKIQIPNSQNSTELKIASIIELINSNDHLNFTAKPIENGIRLSPKIDYWRTDNLSVSNASEKWEANINRVIEEVTLPNILTITKTDETEN